jgi:hypothetical protein
MCRKLCFLISFVLVLCLALDSVSQGAVPGIIGHWKLNDGTGTVAVDSSGNGNDGTLMGDPQWVQGKMGGALDFDGVGDYVNCGNAAILGDMDEITVAGWLTIRSTPTAWASVVAKGENAWRLSANNTATSFHFGITWYQNPNYSVNGATAIGFNEWHHVAGTFDGTTLRIYLDGVLDGSVATTLTIGTAATNMLISENPEATNRYWNGLIDDVRVYNRALTQAEIQFIMTDTGEEPQLASAPSPGDGATDVCRDAVLSWTPGDYAPTTNGHKVFFSEYFTDVNDGLPAALQTDPVEGTPQDSNMYPTTGTLDLDFGTTYYWRVDEANGPGWDEGNVWQFTVELFAFPIENITATASSERNENQGPEKTINESGLDANDLHSTTETDMWLSADCEPGEAWIKYQFDKIYKLHQMWVWNHNSTNEDVLGFGLKDVTIEYSLTGADGDWTMLGGVPEFNQAPGVYDGVSEYAYNTTVDFGGVAAKYVRITAESNWSIIGIKKYGLSEVRFFYIPVRARKPSPTSGVTGVDLDKVLSWRAGREADEHQVYFGTDEQVVATSTTPVDTIPGGECESSYDPPGLLDLGQTYYWRIDEVNESEEPAIWKGDLWNFTTDEYLIVDDMESYNDEDPADPNSNRIFFTWIDGLGDPANGSQVGHLDAPFAEQDIVHGGNQSMPFYYDNSSVNYSEATASIADLEVDGDWTKVGIKALSLWFYGDPNNDATERMYVKLNGVEAEYDGSISDLGEPWWHEWNIDLTELTGMDNVTDISIGFGEPGGGGSGLVYFDDIRLYPARCITSLAKPDADLSGNCVVDYDDIVLLAERWLESGLIVTPVPLGSTNLAAHWKLDEVSGTTAADSAGTYDGTLQGDPLWVAGHDDGAVLLDGDVYVDLPIGSLISSLTNSTFALWENFSDAGGSWQRIFDFGTGETINMFLTPNNGATGSIRFAITTSGAGGEDQLTAPDTLPLGWHHVAVTIDADNDTSAMYLDGLMVVQNTEATVSPNDLGEPNQNWLGRSQYAADPNYRGMIDDFRIYNRALSAGEVASLAGRIEPFSIPADLYEDGAIDLKDFADLGAAWLDEQLWP